MENLKESKGVGGSDKEPLEWKFLGGGGGGGGGESKARLLRTFSRVEALRLKLITPNEINEREECKNDKAIRGHPQIELDNQQFSKQM